MQGGLLLARQGGPVGGDATAGTPVVAREQPWANTLPWLNAVAVQAVRGVAPLSCAASVSYSVVLQLMLLRLLLPRALVLLLHLSMLLPMSHWALHSPCSMEMCYGCACCRSQLPTAPSGPRPPPTAKWQQVWALMLDPIAVLWDPEHPGSAGVHHWDSAPRLWMPLSRTLSVTQAQSLSLLHTVPLLVSGLVSPLDLWPSLRDPPGPSSCLGSSTTACVNFLLS